MKDIFTKITEKLANSFENDENILESEQQITADMYNYFHELLKAMEKENKKLYDDLINFANTSPTFTKAVENHKNKRATRNQTYIDSAACSRSRNYWNNRGC